MSTTFTVNYSELLSDVVEKQGTVAQCYSMFHNFSINNQFLAYYQLKGKGLDITPIASMTNWNKLGRRVKKGEKAIYLWMPLCNRHYTVTDAEGNEVEKSFTSFAYKNRWFSLDQTQGKDFKADEVKMNDFNFDNVYKQFKIELIKFEMLNGNVQGYAKVKTRQLAINPVAQEPEMTILHEVAHIALKHDVADYDSSLKEVEAETVAYIVGSVIGVSEEQLSHSRSYVQSYLQDNKIPDKNAKNIMSVADKILKAGYKK